MERKKSNQMLPPVFQFFQDPGYRFQIQDKKSFLSITIYCNWLSLLEVALHPEYWQCQWVCGWLRGGGVGDRKRQIHQMCSCRLTGQGVLIGSTIAPPNTTLEPTKHCTNIPPTHIMCIIHPPYHTLTALLVIRTGGENWKGLIPFHTWLNQAGWMQPTRQRNQDNGFESLSCFHETGSITLQRQNHHEVLLKISILIVGAVSKCWSILIKEKEKQEKVEL